MNTILCDLSTYNLNHPIYLKEGSVLHPIGSCTMNNIGEVVSALCYQHMADKVLIKGQMGYELAEEIYSASRNKYNEIFKIQSIEVI